ncbi:hypothetical protein HOY82DRAFT_614265 [Tuber indicum]|nr:hypothetical protein HOY82DRAFT_614265 [Tuber indicum]
MEDGVLEGLVVLFAPGAERGGVLVEPRWVGGQVALARAHLVEAARDEAPEAHKGVRAEGRDVPIGGRRRREQAPGGKQFLAASSLERSVEGRGPDGGHLQGREEEGVGRGEGVLVAADYEVDTGAQIRSKQKMGINEGVTDYIERLHNILLRYQSLSKNADNKEICGGEDDKEDRRRTKACTKLTGRSCSKEKLEEDEGEEDLKVVKRKFL